MTENFIDARKSRRRIIEVLKKQQLEDSCCAEQLCQVGLRGKRKILELLAEWMVSFEPDKPSRDVDRETFAAITQVGLEDWLSMQRREATQNQKKIEACRVEEELYKVYDRVAPNGVLSIVFTKGAEKIKAERVREEYRLAKTSREKIECDLKTVLEDMQKAIGRFLRDASRPESMELLARESGIKQELSNLVRDAEENGISVWGPHAQKQLALLRQLEDETQGLSQFYSTSDAKRKEKQLPSDAGER